MTPARPQVKLTLNPSQKAYLDRLASTDSSSPASPTLSSPGRGSCRVQADGESLMSNIKNAKAKLMMRSKSDRNLAELGREEETRGRGILRRGVSMTNLSSASMI
ncbi:hypothetical protein GUITHDRAFT_153397 [Guillardia theta CCMP2712]|uniref:Uncharacterized protein n=1 Tax=Guillardia theta (strain CCMP2712) TaxID=905079 RepID=L1J467_GUITC|nr:hypothetical protein GUITHDRAFT_153397 [Guillardia theta CCMP2712]EKX42929.1 hypothetical protein GUITHDRAFT_153397 [Guillardia theta CCMP2712]|eukprot:XP_005829909.1 hypothetical protein GUITHDRAFT_153397 [Guillardia theta CCMP2712]